MTTPQDAKPPSPQAHLSALFVDWENLKYSLREQTGEEPDMPTLVATLRRRVGRLVVARAYADWDDVDYRRTNDVMRLYRLGIDPVYVPTRSSPYSRRIMNSVDVKMTADAVETVFTHPQIEAFVFVSGDHSLLHPLRSLRVRGVKVYVVGVEGHTSGLLEEQADSLWLYHDLAPRPVSATPSAPVLSVYGAPTTTPPAANGNGKATPKTLDELLKWLVLRVRERRLANNIPLLSWLGGTVSLQIPGFQVSDYGEFERFLDIIQCAERRNLLKIILYNKEKAAVEPDDPLATSMATQTTLSAPDPPPPVAVPVIPIETQLERLIVLVSEKPGGRDHTTLARIADLFAERFPTFRAVDYGMQRFADLVDIAAEQGLVRVIGRAGARFVVLPEPERVSTPAVETPPDNTTKDTHPAQCVAFAPAVIGQIIRACDTRESNGETHTASSLAQVLCENATFPVTDAPENGDSAANTASKAQVEQWLNDAADAEVFVQCRVEESGGKIVPALRLNREHGAVMASIESENEAQDTGKGETAAGFS